MSKVDLFKFLAVDPSSLNLTAQQYYLSYSRYLLNDTTLSIKEKKEQIYEIIPDAKGVPWEDVSNLLEKNGYDSFLN